MQHTTILVVDDDRRVRNSTKVLLEAHGHHVTLAESGSEAMRIVEAGASVAAVLLDVHLQDCCGWTLLGDIKAAAPTVPVIICTGMPELETPLGVEALAIMRKPYGNAIVELLARLTVEVNRATATNAQLTQ